MVPRSPPRRDGEGEPDNGVVKFSIGRVVNVLVIAELQAVQLFHCSAPVAQDPTKLGARIASGL